MQYTDIRFPHLGIVLSHVGRYISIGNFQIMFYGIIIACGFLAGLVVAQQEAKQIEAIIFCPQISSHCFIHLTAIAQNPLKPISHICGLGASIQHAATKITNMTYWLQWFRLFYY